MTLLIDVGNTRIKYCQFSDHGFVSESIVHQQQYRQAMESINIENEQPDSIWVANVAGEQAQKEIQGYCQLTWQLDAHFAAVEQQFMEIKNQYQTLQQMGVDRWLAVIGARAVVEQGDIIIIDAGTAVNIELLNRENHYLGGAILPGMNLMHKALMKNTHITESELEHSALVEVVGQSTKECINSGVQYGLLGAIERVVSTMQAQLQDKARILITGGAASWLQNKLMLDVKQEPDLVLLGLARVARCAK